MNMRLTNLGYVLFLHLEFFNSTSNSIWLDGADTLVDIFFFFFVDIFFSELSLNS